MKIKTAFPPGGEKHTSVWRRRQRHRRRVVDRLALGWGAAGGVGVETGNSFSTYNPTPPLHPARHYRLIGLSPRHSPPPPLRHRPRTRPYPPLSPPPLFASSSLWLQQTSRLQITHDDDNSLREVVHGGDVRACARVRTCYRHDSTAVYLLNPPHRPIDWNSPVASSS